MSEIKGRSGQTKVTSVSLSKEFKQFMDDYNISPTEAVRKGVSIILFERGLPQYKSETNKQRYEAMKEVLKTEQMQNFPDKIKLVEELLREIRSAVIL